ncbi:MAG TPA: ATP-binding cassette domain-containing protein [Streptosporangiaceae bacterium]|nr:ATP-binding cassette domain-containing protein [Streptosporangiaceae bacterium]
MTALPDVVAPGLVAGPDTGRAASDGAGPVITVSGLGVTFGPVRALDGVDLSIMPGEVTALAGESGAGKTTLLRALGGDLKPSRGEILFRGRPLPADPLAVARCGVGVVWQDLSLCDNLDIASNLMLGRERRRQLLSEVKMHADASSLMSSLGIPLTDTTRSVRSLSGGQRQLVAIARAMAGRPPLLLLDEPTKSLSIKHAAQFEDLIAAVRHQTTVVIACHDLDLMFRLASRIVVLRHGRIVAEVNPATVHPDEVVALLSGQEVDSSARRQLTRLHGLTGKLVAADASSSLSLILSALGAALGSERLCMHLATGGELACAASLGLPDALLDRLARLPIGVSGGPAGLAAATERTVIAENAPADWELIGGLAAAGIASSWSVPVLARDGLAGVITGFGDTPGRPERDQLELVTVYAGYAASAIERDQLLSKVTERNRVLETIREVLETLAGPIPVSEGIPLALQSLCRGLQAAEVTLMTCQDGGQPQCRGSASPSGPGRAEAAELCAARLIAPGAAGAQPGTAQWVSRDDGQRDLAVTFTSPGGLSVLLARWEGDPPTAAASVVVEDAAHSLRLALEREQAGLAQQEATALRRSQELQRDFLSRLSHELRTPLTAIRGYATSLLQPDVTWDAESQQRFLTRIAAESARLGRLVDDLLDFSAIELGILRLQPDWCDIELVLEAAVACLPPDGRQMVRIDRTPDLPVIWADHDRLEQVFVNLLANAIGHNPPGTEVTVRAEPVRPAQVSITVTDEGVGLPADIAVAPFEPRRLRSSKTGGAGLGLSITRGIVTAHGGKLEVKPSAGGASFTVTLPIEDGVAPLAVGEPRIRAGLAPGSNSGRWVRKEAFGRGGAHR